MDTTKEEEPDEDDEQLDDQIEEAEVDTSFEEERLGNGREEDGGQENKEDASMEEDDVMKEAEEASNVNGAFFSFHPNLKMMRHILAEAMIPVICGNKPAAGPSDENRVGVALAHCLQMFRQRADHFART